jgi:hypothetical protein
MPKAEFDKQGKYFWHLVKRAGWTEERVNALLLKRWQTTHWNALHANDKRAAINMMRGYAEKQEKNQCKGIRQGIVALAARNGYNLDWVHERMAEWQYGESMRELGFTKLMCLRRDLIGVFNGINAGAEATK